jgi:acetyl esterase/lipase
MPIYPMIDDRETFSSKDNTAPVWDSKSNELGWGLYLRGLKEIPVYAAPARATDYSKLPPTITFIGSVEPFRDETIAYVENLEKANVPVQFELFEGCFHAFERFGANTTIGKRTTKFLLDNYKEFVERYFRL